MLAKNKHCRCRLRPGGRWGLGCGKAQGGTGLWVWEVTRVSAGSRGGEDQGASPGPPLRWLRVGDGDEEGLGEEPRRDRKTGRPAGPPRTAARAAAGGLLRGAVGVRPPIQGRTGGEDARGSSRGLREKRKHVGSRGGRAGAALRVLREAAVDSPGGRGRGSLQRRVRVSSWDSRGWRGPEGAPRGALKAQETV